jgi:hypothetical protein
MTTTYWTVSKAPANRLFNCRECKGIIYKGAPMVCRDGRKLRLHYHEECFSGEADLRTQENSSVGGKFAAVISPHAPSRKGAGKWSTSYGYQPNLESTPHQRTTPTTTTTSRAAGKSSSGGDGGDGGGGSSAGEGVLEKSKQETTTTSTPAAAKGVVKSSPPPPSPKSGWSARSARSAGVAKTSLLRVEGTAAAAKPPQAHSQ